MTTSLTEASTSAAPASPHTGGDNAAPKPLAPVAGDVPRIDGITAEKLAALLSGPAHLKALRYFLSYPQRSLMSDHSRAALYLLIRALQPRGVAEIGTMYAGTTEVLARAVWENGGGVVHTTDPFGAERCPPIIGSWPRELQSLTKYHALNSMDFFIEVDKNKYELDLILVDGNHDYEFALFDLMMAARYIQRGGIIVMDNAEQSGPFRASREFLRDNPAWKELGNAVSSYRRSRPFDTDRASSPQTTFVILQAPSFFTIGEGPHSWGQTRTKASSVKGFTLDLPQQSTAGVLHYHMILRAFPAIGPVQEKKSVGKLRIVADKAESISHMLPAPLVVAPDATYTFEIDLSWEADDGAPPLAMNELPTPI